MGRSSPADFLQRPSFGDALDRPAGRRTFANSSTENTHVETIIGVSEEADAPECETAS